MPTGSPAPGAPAAAADIHPATSRQNRKSLSNFAGNMASQQHWWLAQEVPEFSSQLQRQLEFNRFARDSSAPIFLRRTLRHAPRAPSLPTGSAAARCGGGLTINHGDQLLL